MKKTLLLVFINLLFCNTLFSQSIAKKKIDSLKALLPKQSIENKIKTHIRLSNEFDRISIDSAIVHAKKAVFFSENFENKHLKAATLHQLATTYYINSNYDKSEEIHLKSLKISIEEKDSILIANNYNGLGNLYSKTDKFTKSTEHFFKSLPIYEKVKDTKMIAGSYVNIAINFRKIKEPFKSIEYNKKALNIFLKIKNEVLVAMTYTNLGGVYNDVNKYRKSIEYSKKGKEYFKKLGYHRYTAYPITNIGISYDSLQKPQLAQKNYAISIKLHTKNRDPYELSFLYNALANSYYKQKKYQLAIKNGLKAYSLAQEISSSEFMSTSAKTLSKAYRQANNFKESLRFLDKYAVLKDSLFKKEKTTSIFNVQEKYDTAKKEKEILQQKEELLKNELKIKNSYFYTTLLAAALLILGILSFGYYKKTQFKRQQLQKEIDLKDALSKIKTQNRLQEQRLRISRDLHDNIGSQLTFIISSIDNLQFVTKDANNALKNKLSTISSFTSDTIFQLRDTIWAMNKDLITSDDLHIRILSFAEKAKIASPNTTFTVDHSVTKMIYFTSIIGVNLFRVIQEAINNAIKYADASEITVHASVERNTLTITVIDNGNGFDIANVQLGNGLANMEKRMSEINGKIHINSKTTVGTTITLTLYLKNTSNAV